METTTIEPNWEVSIPPEMLNNLDIKEGDDILMIRKGNEISLRKLV